MIYPTISEYIESIKSAEDNFNELSSLRPVLDDDGNPIMSSGNFAVVFKMTDGEKDYAIKCFTKEQEGRAFAYKRISEYLDSKNSQFLVKFKFLDRELFVDTTQGSINEFPVVQLDWIDGLSLDIYIKSIKNDKRKRECLAESFREMTLSLLSEPFAHGDIKPDNIIVTSDGDLKLIDYDGMFVPSMYGEKAREGGSPAFRHPNRLNLPFDRHVDDYPLTLILLLLSVNAVDSIDIEEKAQKVGLQLIYGLPEEIISKREIAPIISAYLYVCSLGFLDEKLISSLLSSNKSFDFSLEKELKEKIYTDFDTKAMIKLADLYDKGNILPQDKSAAYKWYSIATLFGDVNAYCGLCRCLYREDALSKDTYMRIAQNGYGFAYCRLGEECFHREREKACGYFRKGINLNSPQAMNWLAILLSSESEEESIALYKKAAEMGLISAQLELAEKFGYGRGVEKDEVKAVEWYKKAAEQGDATAQNSLGVCYYNGTGVEKDIAKAVEWFRKAAEQGDATAQCNLGVCYANGRGVEKDETIAVEWYKKAAGQGHARAEFLLAGYFEKGIIMGKNLEVAKMLYSKAVKRNIKGAKEALERVNHLMEEEIDDLPF